jgi:DNA-binding GntR family transcriptional regulator
MKLDMVFDSRKKMPFYVQFADHIKMLVANRLLSYGFIFESPDVISSDLKVPKDEIIKGFHMLLKEGFLTLNNHVYQLSPIMLTNEIFSDIVPLQDSISQMGYQATVKTVASSDVKKLPDMFKEVTLDPLGYLYLRRVYFANQIPVAVVDGYYPKSFLERKDLKTFEHQTMYTYFKEQGHTLSHTKKSIRVVHPTEDINKFLNNPSDASSIQISGMMFNEHHEVLEYVISVASINYSIYTKEVISYT